MAGTDPTGAFDADEFREGIRAAMLMGLPDDEEMRPTFHFPAGTVNDSADPGGKPWDFNQPKSVDSTPAPDPVLVLCAVKVTDGQAGYTSVGKFLAREAVLSFFEDEWAAANDPVPFNVVFIGAKPYKRAEELEPVGMFEVTTYRVRVVAEDI